MGGGDVMLVVQTLRDYLQPDAADHIIAQVDKFTSCVRTDQPIEKFLMEFGILRRKAENRCFRREGASPTYILASCAFGRHSLNPPKKPC